MTQARPRKLRQPIVVVLGHVDHGKTTLLDKIRGTAVVKKEPGEMTQHVGASLVPASVVNKLAEPLKKIIPFKLEIPGLLFIDTPGHELFANLRRRGGSVADIAILVIDINEGVMPQTRECLEILRERKVPFIVAANKVDKVPGWRPKPDSSILLSLREQSPTVQSKVEELIYKVVAQLADEGVEADFFTRVRDFNKTVAVVPTSAKTGEGIPELLAILAGVTQRYMSERLLYAEGPAKGVILEVKEQPGYGPALDVIIYDGVLRERDTIVLGGLGGPIVTKVRALLLPKPLTDIRIARAELRPVEEVVAAAGVRVIAPDIEEAIAGSPIFSVQEEAEIEKVKQQVREEIEAVRVRREVNGVVIKADSLGSLEALVNALTKRGVPVRLADIGPLTKRDIMEASVVAKSDRYLGVALLFNVKSLPGVEEMAAKEGIKIFSNNIIYKLIEEYLTWMETEKKQELQKELEQIALPAKIKILPGFVFRRSDPAIVGVMVLGGILRPGASLLRADGKKIGEVLQIQHMGKPLKEAKSGQEVAISIKGNVIVGRHIDEGEVIYVDIPLEHARRLLTKFRDILTEDSLEVLREVVRIKASKDPEYSALLALL